MTYEAPELMLVGSVQEIVLGPPFGGNDNPNDLGMNGVIVGLDD